MCLGKCMSFISLRRNMRLRTDREPNEFLPKVYTCEGMEKFPEFHLDDVPLVAK